MFGRKNSQKREESVIVVNEQASGARPQRKQKNKAPFLVKPGKGYFGRAGQSLKRWWWLWFLIVASITLVITLPIVYVLYPRLSQQGIDETTITVQGLELANPSPDTYLFSINTTLYPQTPFKVSLDPFNVSFYLTDYDLVNPFTVVEFPSIYVDHVTAVNITDQVVPIDNVTAWEQYLSVAFSNEDYRVTTIGNTKLHLGSLPKNNVFYNKTVSIPGFNGLTQISVSNLTVILTPDVLYNFYATANVVNPSPSTVIVGNITYDTYIAPNDTFIGQTFLTDVTLGPGDNIFNFKASSQQGPVVKALGVHPYCEHGVIQVTIVPNSTTFNGKEVPWLLPTLVNVTQMLPIGDAIEKADGGSYNITCPKDSD